VPRLRGNDGPCSEKPDRLNQRLLGRLISVETPGASVALPEAVLPPALEGAQADADLTASAQLAGASGIRLADQLDHLPPVHGAGQPSASSKQKASHFFGSTNSAAASASAFCLRCSPCLRALISRWSWTLSFSNSFCSVIVSTGLALASLAACRQRPTCSGKRPAQGSRRCRQRPTCAGKSPRSGQ